MSLDGAASCARSRSQAALINAHSYEYMYLPALEILTAQRVRSRRH